MHHVTLCEYYVANATMVTFMKGGRKWNSTKESTQGARENVMNAVGGNCVPMVTTGTAADRIVVEFNKPQKCEGLYCKKML